MIVLPSSALELNFILIELPSGTIAEGACVYSGLMEAVYVVARKYLPLSNDRKKAIS